MIDGDDGPRRVLVVEDDESLLDLIGEMLRYCGCEPDLARSGQEALRLVSQRAYALILVDFILPGIGGQAFYRALTRRLPNAAERVVFMTGADLEASPLREFLLESGRPALSKPFGVRSIENLVRATLGA